MTLSNKTCIRTVGGAFSLTLTAGFTVSAAGQSTSGDRNVVAIGNAVQDGITAGTVSADNVATLDALTSAAYDTALLDALPSLSEGAGREIFESSSAASQKLDRHLADDGLGLWGQFIVRGADQDALSLSAAGYEASETIFTIGGDLALSQNARIGALASYADIDVDDLAANSSSATAQVESIKLGLYTAIELFDRGFFNTEVAYLTGDVETARSGLLGTITSGFDFDGITGRASLGYDLLPDEHVSITPSIGVNAAKIEFDDAQEAGGFGFAVVRGDAEYVELRGGIELGAQISPGVDGLT